jgi:transposase
MSKQPKTSETKLATNTSGGKAQMRVLAQCVGVDVSKDSLSCCFTVQRQSTAGGGPQTAREAGREVKVRSSKQLANSPAGIKELKAWIAKWQEADLLVNVVMEATGVYHYRLAYALSDVADIQGLRVCVVLPNRAKHYAGSLSTKTKTDHTDAQMLAQMGVERDLPVWQAPGTTMRQIKVLCRERETLRKDSVAVANRQHALEYSGLADKATLKRHKDHIAFLATQIKAIDKQILKLVQTDPALEADVARLCTIPGVGWITAIIVLAETDSFALIRNKNQLTSYAGLDIVERQSGTSLRGKTRISKKGNSHLRAALYFPAISHIRARGCFTALFNRVAARGARGLKAYVAVQRKLLILMYSLHKNKTVYTTPVQTEAPIEALPEVPNERSAGLPQPQTPPIKKEIPHTQPEEKKGIPIRPRTARQRPITPNAKTGKFDLVEPACTA